MVNEQEWWHHSHSWGEHSSCTQALFGLVLSWEGDGAMEQFLRGDGAAPGGDGALKQLLGLCSCWEHGSAGPPPPPALAQLDPGEQMFCRCSLYHQSTRGEAASRRLCCDCPGKRFFPMSNLPHVPWVCSGTVTKCVPAALGSLSPPAATCGSSRAGLCLCQPNPELSSVHVVPEVIQSTVLSGPWFP